MASPFDFCETTMIVIIDNYDSFTYNIVQTIGGFGAEMIVFRNPYKVKEGDRIQADVKRVVGLPSETVHVRRDRVVISFACAQAGGARGPDSAPVQPVDGPCQQTFATSTIIGGGSFGHNGNEFDMYLGPQDYFVLGDNRRDSSAISARYRRKILSGGRLSVYCLSHDSLSLFY